jgi:hypothetical protein
MIVREDAGRGKSVNGDAGSVKDFKRHPSNFRLPKYIRMVLLAGMVLTTFVKENDLYYANVIDGNSIINPVNIVSGATTTVEFDITYLAYF